ncbi:MAG: ABC transporter substrate-binding protein [Opitutaceae bacterium]|nr:ABC transporter substrate-binding protein [Opitutaceae bacterium]
MRTATLESKNAHPASPAAVRIGFIALNDAAPLIVAQEQGFFRREGVTVELRREVGWATIRDKIISGELDGAHALGAMVLGTTLGLNCRPTPCLTACVLNLNGNSITLSEGLWAAGVRDAATLREEIHRVRPGRVYVLGVVYPHSSHRIHLVEWLRAAGIHPDRDVRIVVVPPPQLFRNLAAGTIDGYCAGDPWNSLAVREKLGWTVATSHELSPGHPEKVFMVRSEFAERRHLEHLALVRALHEAARLCDDPSFRPDLARLLARREYLNVPERVIAAGLVGPYAHGHGRSSDATDFVVFHRQQANDPTAARAGWLIDHFARAGLISPGAGALPSDLGYRTFRSDLFHQALQRHTTTRHDEVHASLV